MTDYFKTSGGVEGAAPAAGAAPANGDAAMEDEIMVRHGSPL